jgi:hypothetical protein
MSAGYRNWRLSMSSVQIDQKSYEMPPKDGISIACFLTVADLERSARRVCRGEPLETQGSPARMRR